MADNKTIRVGNGKQIKGKDAFKLQINLTKLNEALKDNPSLKNQFKTRDGSINEVAEIEIWPNKEEYQTQHQTHYARIVEPYRAER